MAKKQSSKKGLRKQKYNWAAIREDFFRSEYHDVKVYFEAKYSLYNPHIQRSTAGWADKKAKWEMEIADERLAKFAAEKGERIGTLLNDMVLLIESDVVNMKKGKVKINAKALKNYHEISRTEAGLPTRIIHTRNENTNVDVNSKPTLLDKLKAKFNGEPTSPTK